MRLRIKDFATKVGSGVTPKGGASVYQDNGIPLFRSQNVTNDGFLLDDIAYISEEIHKSMIGTRLMPNDVLLNITGASIGRCYYLPKNFKEGNVNQHVCIIRPKGNVLPAFLYYNLISAKGQHMIDLCQTGANREGLTKENICNFEFDIPPIETQQRMVTYLDTKLSEIHHQVSLLTSKRDAYLRLKKSIINHAVTRGLNPNVKMKDSGIEWIGEVPEHWEVKRMKELSAIGSGTTPKSGEDKYYENGIHPWLNTSDVQDCVINEAKFSITDKALNDYSVLKYYPIGTILIAMYGGGTIGNVALMNISATINQACCAIVSNEKLLLPKYLFCYLKCHKKKIISLGFGGTQVNLSQAIIAQLPVVLPPLPEQHALATYLDDKCAKIDTILSNLNKQISCYGDLKRSLIDEVITGKRAV